MYPTRQFVPLAIFTLGYVALAGAYFTLAGNYEFLWYIAVMVLLIGLAGATLKTARLPLWLLWLLSLWGLLHILGGGVFVGDHVLYAQVLIPIVGDGEFTVLKYDQVVHAYGFGVSALMVRHLVSRASPDALSGVWLSVLAASAAMGLGAVNEIVEFVAVVVAPSTGVGGYYNTALDLVFNGLGAILAVTVASLVGKEKEIG